MPPASGESLVIASPPDATGPHTRIARQCGADHFAAARQQLQHVARHAGLVEQAEILLVIGTSLVVYPAAGLIDFALPGVPKYIIDPSVPGLYRDDGWKHIRSTAAKGTPPLVEELLNEYV